MPVSGIESLSVTVAIPTYGREEFLVDTIVHLLTLEEGAEEILVLDQTPAHDVHTERHLRRWDATGRIRWVRLSEPSIPRAMNRGLIEASCDVVLFLDDDIIPDGSLAAVHRKAHGENPGCLVAGRVLQPWHGGRADGPSDRFCFNSHAAGEVAEFMGGNFSLPREAAIDVGGFDENFVGAAYRFEAEFAHRWRKSGRSILYEPGALIHHLKAESGGTRVHGEHMTTAGPEHAVGAYYFMLVTFGRRAYPMMVKRLLGSVATRHHVRRPWWIPVTLTAEVRGIAWAGRLYKRGARLIWRGEQHRIRPMDKRA